eukprot:CAMPEP_0184433118 /NCGR_PEP_ID=MMETSP0738-20130409/379324_1 /TAXON_ID=385413 /ORGANISM="Thalassiosira miniscula, Strain CCMP1093" /LENGTH=82 /DNA_ID=CAMNT_0026798685 /DNA_START=263 /DNA_END=511 /DNA_ORIENTATION=+
MTDADVIALSSGLKRDPCPVVVSYMGICSTNAKLIAPRSPAKTRTNCIRRSMCTPSMPLFDRAEVAAESLRPLVSLLKKLAT